MNFLLTNDDGIDAPGLWTAARALARLGNVLVVAPVWNYSGYGPAHPPYETLSCTPYPTDCDIPANVKAYALMSTPAACAQVGLSGALSADHIDMVISGVNDAPNMGRNILYSGTVGAAMTAYLMGVPAIALSLAARPSDSYHWDSAAWAVEEGLRIWREQYGARPIILNINVPNVARSALRGTITTSLSSTTFLSAYHVLRPAGDANLIQMTKQAVDGPAPEPWSDAWAVENGFVSVTPLRLFPDVVSDAPYPAVASVAAPLLLTAPARLW